MANQDVAALNHLPNELLRNICKHCRSSYLAHLSLTSSSLKAIANAILYEDVDLAIHNDTQTGYSARKPYYSDYESHVLSKTASAQNLFLRTLYENRNRETIAKQVTSLSWTFLFFNLNPADRVDHRNYILAPKGGRKPEKTIWTVFKTLRHTKKLNLAILYVNITQQYRFSTDFHTFQGALFPSATSIKLSGTFNYAFVASILVPKAAKITHLVFDTERATSCDRATFEEWKTPSLLLPDMGRVEQSRSHRSGYRS